MALVHELDMAVGDRRKPGRGGRPQECCHNRSKNVCKQETVLLRNRHTLAFGNACPPDTASRTDVDAAIVGHGIQM